MSRSFPTKEQLLYRHINEATAFVVDDYPYGFRLRCKIRYWVESTKHGDRFCSQTTNPKTSGEVWNKPKKTTYYNFIFMYLDDKDHVNWNAIHYHGETTGNQEFKELLRFVMEIYGLENFSKPAQVTLRLSYFMNIKVCFTFRKNKYLAETLPAFEKWTKDTLEHVAHCEYAEICNHADAPAQDGDKDAVFYTLSKPVNLMDMMAKG